MKFINYLTKITGVDVFGMTSFLLFFFLFIIAAIWAWKADKKLIDDLGKLPLDHTIPE